MVKMDEKGIYWTNGKKKNTFRWVNATKKNNYAQSLWKA